MLLRAIRPFAAHPRIGEIVVVLPSEVLDDLPDWLADVAKGRLRVVAGGKSRTESVQAGLNALSPDVKGVLVHDAARPFVTAEVITQVLERVVAGGSAVAAVPVADTLKRSTPGGTRVFETIPRGGLWQAQTPQGFARETLEQAYRWWAANGAGEATDDAALVEALGLPIELVPDRTTNLKITTADDFRLAEALAAP
jgi:2-C-methyl-D-erythritol 4-phosphate cytidylyltransferase